MRPIPILMYHNVGRPVPGDRKPRLFVGAQAFARQMAALRLLGIRGLSMRDAMPYLKGKAQGRVAVITFDDGYVDTFELALPVLQYYGHTATCYAVSQRLGECNTWDAEHIRARKPLMNAAQLRRWSAAGMDVGAHTQTHPWLPKCDDDDLAREIGQCKADLEALLEVPITQFCYPYGAFDDRVVSAVRKAGYEAATTTQRGTAKAGADAFLLPRERPRLSRILFKQGLSLGS